MAKDGKGEKLSIMRDLMLRIRKREAAKGLLGGW